MYPFAAYVVALHLQDLREEAARERLARQAREANDDVASWRRGLAAVLASAARVADPCIELASAARRSADSTPARTFAA